MATRGRCAITALSQHAVCLCAQFICCAAQVDRALGVLDRMGAEAVSPDVYTYTALITACEKAGRAGDALEVFRWMCDRQVTPNAVTYTALVSACGHARMLDRAFEVYYDAVRAGCRLDVGLCNALISACARDGQAERALEVYRGMAETQACSPACPSY